MGCLGQAAIDSKWHAVHVLGSSGPCSGRMSFICLGRLPVIQLRQPTHPNQQGHPLCKAGLPSWPQLTAWLQPSATLRYAVCVGVSRTLSHSGRNGTVASPTCTLALLGAEGRNWPSSFGAAASSKASSKSGGATAKPLKLLLLAATPSTGARPRLPRRLLPS